MFFKRIYLDLEKDIIIDLYLDSKMHYVLSTPNHHTGNLISNLAKLCHLKISYNKEGLKIIEDDIPCFINTYNEEVYILRLGGIKIANIYKDGRIDMKASIPSISKTLMSQTKHYTLPLSQTIMKSYIKEEYKFHTDLHTHLNANLSPDILIALGIYHQIKYPLYYIKKLGLQCSDRQIEQLHKERLIQVNKYKDSSLKGKYLDRKIDDHTYINFADLILHNKENIAYNLPRIRASLSMMKDGQAVFSNVEKVYLYRYVFTKGIPSLNPIELEDIECIGDDDIVSTLQQMILDHQGIYHNNLYQDKLLWIARSYKNKGIDYVEMSDTSLVKKEAPIVLKDIHEVMPLIYKETGVLIRFLAGIRRIPLTIVRDNITPDDYLKENLRILRAIYKDPYIAGSDILGEEINDIREIAPVIKEIVSIAKNDKSFVIRIHAGENDSLKDNVAYSIKCVKDALYNQDMPYIRIGHGLYTSNLSSSKGKQLLKELQDDHITLEFQMTSNIRLNNLSQVTNHPLKHYLKAGIHCVQGTDGSALYGTNPMDEQLSLENLLHLNHQELLSMRHSEDRIREAGIKAYQDKLSKLGDVDIQTYYEDKIQKTHILHTQLFLSDHTLDAHSVLKNQIKDLPIHKTPIIIAGGSFNNSVHKTVMMKEYKDIIDVLLQKLDPKKNYFVIGHTLTGYEKYLLDNNTDFDIYTYVPSQIDEQTLHKLQQSNTYIRVAIEPVSMGLYKSITYEILKRHNSLLFAFDGNSPLTNLIQEARNYKKTRIYINIHNRMLKEKASTLTGYISSLDDISIEDILRYTGGIK